MSKKQAMKLKNKQNIRRAMRPVGDQLHSSNYDNLGLVALAENFVPRRDSEF